MRQNVTSACNESILTFAVQYGNPPEDESRQLEFGVHRYYVFTYLGDTYVYRQQDGKDKFLCDVLAPFFIPFCSDKSLRFIVNIRASVLFQRVSSQYACLNFEN